MFGQGAAGNLDREKLQFFIPGGRCDGVGAHHWFLRVGQTDHQELARTEPEGLRPRYAKAEQAVGVMLHLRYLFGKHARGDNVVMDGVCHINTVRYNERHLGGNGNLRKCKNP